MANKYDEFDNKELLSEYTDLLRRKGNEELFSDEWRRLNDIAYDVELEILRRMGGNNNENA